MGGESASEHGLQILLSAVVLGELPYGFRDGSRYERNARGMRAFLDNPYVSIVPVGEDPPPTGTRGSRRRSVAVDADGMYVVRGRLEPEVGAVLMRAIEAASDALYRGEDADRRPRNRQRRADAAGLVAERALAAGFGGGSGRAERYQVVVHAEAARVAMGHRDGEVVSVGRRRTIPPHIRRALEERDRGCRYPGCASRFTEAHHVK